MKSILTLIAIAIALNSNAQDVVCEKQGRYWKPKNEKAIKIATALDVKTCQGDRFREVLAKSKLSHNVPDKKASRLTVDEIAEQVK